jgi:quinate dehydrogenase (quinone)
MTFSSPKSGRQFVVLTAGGGTMSRETGDYVIAYALPR